MKTIAVVILLLLMIGCATIPKEGYSDDNPRLEYVGMQHPIQWLIIVFLRDKETGRVYAESVNTITGSMSTVEVR